MTLSKTLCNDSFVTSEHHLIKHFTNTELGSKERLLIEDNVRSEINNEPMDNTREEKRAFVLYGTWIVWSGWAICLSLIERNEIKREEGKSWDLSAERDGDEFVISELKGTELPPFLVHSDWTSTFFPILSFLLLLTLRRGHWGLITWEHLVLLEATSHLKWYRIWCLSGASAGWILFWEGVKYYFHIALIYRTDLTAFPGIAGTVWTNLWSGMLLAMWWSFWTFQYRGVVWKRELLEGVAVWSDDDGWVRVGGVGQEKLG
ncbi:2011_t:CDS:2 [Paraglomus occultum]|uniref:2011_t:CDS:1 n=1 Tax=Paraglomus occultum TaxID=144539 RepID=A0A9N8W5P8_9GLOM|nr:2011_t:CDS:2 [Paraglomus occultum]